MTGRAPVLACDECLVNGLHGHTCIYMVLQLYSGIHWVIHGLVFRLSVSCMNAVD